MPPEGSSRKPKRKQSRMPETPDSHEAMPPPRRLRSPGTRKEDWIGNQLRRVYSEVAEEAIPQQMIDLLNALDDSDPEAGESQ